MNNFLFADYAKVDQLGEISLCSLWLGRRDVSVFNLSGKPCDLFYLSCQVLVMSGTL